MFQRRDDLLWGLSAKPVNYQDSIPILIWVDNPNDKPVGVATCSGIGYFWLTGIDVFDSEGHRMRGIGEGEQEKKPSIIQNVFSCGRNIFIEIPPHTCKHTTFTEHAFDFWRDLSQAYDLAPGRYFVVPGRRISDFKPVERTVLNPTIALEVNVEKRNQ